MAAASVVHETAGERRVVAGWLLGDFITFTEGLLTQRRGCLECFS